MEYIRHAQGHRKNHPGLAPALGPHAVLPGQFAHAERRVALVIGNAAYKEGSPGFPTSGVHSAFPFRLSIPPFVSRKISATCLFIQKPLFSLWHVTAKM